MEKDIGFRFKRIHDAIKAGFDNQLKTLDLTFSQMTLLGILFRNDGKKETTQKDIEVYLGLKHPTVVGIVHRLEANGFIRVGSGCCAGRSKIVELTDKGRNVKKNLDENRKRNNEAMLSGFTEEEQTALKGYLDRIYENMVSLQGGASSQGSKDSLEKESERT